MNASSPIIVEYNDRLAPLYDAATADPNAWTAPAQCFRLLQPHLRPGLEVLDLGVGTGAMSALLHRAGCRITGIDISQKMLDIAKAKMPDATLIRADIRETVSFSHATQFDAVVAVGVFEFIEDLGGALARTVRLLRPGGHYCLTFEDLVSESAIQCHRMSPRGLGFYDEIPRLLSFPVFRRTWEEVVDVVRESGLHLLDGGERFVAYTMTVPDKPMSFPIAYRAVLAEKR
jgi:predicted TPR repeat methyltransferase